MSRNRESTSNYIVCEKCKKKSAISGASGFCVDCFANPTEITRHSLQVPSEQKRRSTISDSSSMVTLFMAESKQLLPDFIFDPSSYNVSMRSSTNSKYSFLLKPPPKVSISDCEIFKTKEQYNLTISEHFLPEDLMNTNILHFKKIMPNKKNILKCESCGKKLNITNHFTCRCDGIYCANHRADADHQCKFDYKKKGQLEIANQNPLIVGQKVVKI